MLNSAHVLDLFLSPDSFRGKMTVRPDFHCCSKWNESTSSWWVILCMCILSGHKYPATLFPTRADGRHFLSPSFSFRTTGLLMGVLGISALMLWSRLLVASCHQQVSPARHWIFYFYCFDVISVTHSFCTFSFLSLSSLRVWEISSQFFFSPRVRWNDW